MRKFKSDFEDLNADPLIIKTMETGVRGLELTLSAIKTFDISLSELEEGLRIWSSTRRGLRGRLKYCFPYWVLNQGDKSWNKLHPLFFPYLADFFYQYFPIRDITEDTWMGEGFLPGLPASHSWERRGPYSRSDQSRYDIRRLSFALYLVSRQTRVEGLPYEQRTKYSYPDLSKTENEILNEILRVSLEINQRGGLRDKLVKESAEHFERENKQWDVINARLRGGFFKRPDDEDVKP